MTYAHEFRYFVLAQSPDKPKDGSTYSGSSRKHYGLSNPTMRNFVKQFAEKHPDLTYEDWEATLSALYQGKSIDERCLAGFMLGQYKQFRKDLPLPVLETWIGQLEGWREIDTTCQSNFTAKELLAEWDSWKPFLVDLSQSENISQRRASLVLLVKPVRESDDKRLITIALANVERLKLETDKLITKAISWILREAIKQHSATVANYVEVNSDSLPSIAVREFKQKYKTGKK